MTASRPHVDGAVRGLATVIVPRAFLAAQQLRALHHPCQRIAHGPGVPEEAEVVLAERPFSRGAPQVGLQHVRVGGVDHRRLGRLVEQVCGVIDEVLIQRIVLSNEHG